MDSGANNHITVNLLPNYVPCQSNISSVNLANGAPVPVLQAFDAPIPGLTLHEVLHCPSMRHNLISALHLCLRGHKILLSAENCIIYPIDPNDPPIIGSRRGDHWIIPLTSDVMANHVSASTKAIRIEGEQQIMELHRKFGHTSIHSLAQFADIHQSLL